MQALAEPRRTSLRALTVGAVAFLLVPLLMFTQAPPAQASGGEIVPVVAGGTVVAGADVVAVPGEIVAGAALGGYWLGKNYFGPKLSWLFSSGHTIETAAGANRVPCAQATNLGQWGVSPWTCGTGTGYGATFTSVPPAACPAGGPCTAVLSIPAGLCSPNCAAGGVTVIWKAIVGAGTSSFPTGSQYGSGTCPTYTNVAITCTANTGTVASPYSVAGFQFDANGWQPVAGTAPLHELKTTVTCADGSVQTAYTAPFHESDAIIPVPVLPTCPVGVAPTGATVGEGDANGQNAPASLTQTWTPPSAWTSTTDPLRDCYPGGSNAPCALTVLKVSGSALLPCSDPSVDCTSYSAASTSSQYQCRWGTHVIATSDCRPLAGTFSAPVVSGGSSSTTVPGTVPVTGSTTVTNPDGSKTTTTTQQLPDGTLQRVTDTTYPNGSRTVTTTTVDVNGNPTGTPVTVTFPPTSPDGTTASDPTSGDNACSFGLKPWLWPYRALTCAFEPSSTTTTQLSSLSSDFQTRVPFSWFSEVGAYVVGALGGAGASGCLVYDVHLGTLGSFHIINSCDDTEPVVHAVRLLRPVAAAAELLAFLGPLAWWAWRQYAPLSNG